MTQYLTFKLGSELYGLDLLEIQEIRGYTPATPLPNAPMHFKGVINLRGVIVPVVDLRSQFGLSPEQPNKLNVIVVVNVKGRITGLLVDAVADVVEMNPADIKAAPPVSGAMPPSFIRGMVKIGEQLLIVLEIDRVVNSGDAELAA